MAYNSIDTGAEINKRYKRIVSDIDKLIRIIQTKDNCIEKAYKIIIRLDDDIADYFIYEEELLAGYHIRR